MRGDVTYVEQWLRAFAVTALVELGAALPLLREAEPSRIRRVGGVVVANLATHPVVWFVIPALGMDYRASVTLSEAWAVGMELVVYRLVFRLSLPRACAVSALANGASFAVGLLLRFLTAWP